MPQKRNPSALEVSKAKAAVAQGLLVSLLSLSRGSFVGYNRDSQWTKYVIIDLIYECAEAPIIMASVLNTLTINHERAKELCKKGFITATDLMEALAQDFSLPLRQAKMVIERAVKYSESQNTETVSWEELRRALQELNLTVNISPDFVKEQQEPEAVVRRRKAIGGPAPEILMHAIDTLSPQIQDIKVWLAEKENQLRSSYQKLEDIEKGLLNLTP